MDLLLLNKECCSACLHLMLLCWINHRLAAWTSYPNSASSIIRSALCFTLSYCWLIPSVFWMSLNKVCKSPTIFCVFFWWVKVKYKLPLLISFSWYFSDHLKVQFLFCSVVVFFKSHGTQKWVYGEAVRGKYVLISQDVGLRNISEH